MSYLNDTINEFLHHICLSITILFTIIILLQLLFIMTSKKNCKRKFKSMKLCHKCGVYDLYVCLISFFLADQLTVLFISLPQHMFFCLYFILILLIHSTAREVYSTSRVFFFFFSWTDIIEVTA